MAFWLRSTPPAPAGTPSYDHRPDPPGVLWRTAKIVLTGGLAFVLLVFLLVAGRGEEKPRPEAKPRDVSAPTARQLMSDSADLMGLAARERARAAASELERMRTEPPATLDHAGPASAPSGSRQDSLAEDRKRKDYESLFASNVVASKRSFLGTSSLGNGPGRGMEAPPKASSLDEIAAAVVRASGGQTSPVPPGVTPAGSTGQIATPPIAERTDPLSDAGPNHTLLESTLIDAVLKNRLDGSTASPVNALVTNPIYSHRGTHVLIPSGAEVIGQTTPVSSTSDARLAVAFHRLIFPDGSSVSLDHEIGLHLSGATGLTDQVDRHYLGTFGASAAVGLIQGLSQYFSGAGVGRGAGDNRTVVLAGTVGDSAAQSSQRVMDHFLNRLPTITIREGTRLKIYITHDLELPAYTGR